ncbi:phosphate-starvation-inducible protein PsiE [Bacillus canaveralius]|uniref:Protein PsiE n=1 Tax=Bacillus canaveralius TaxID=1403243 RepID=A0A2N5GS62_9BACI|nr:MULTISPECIES: phosphate-starvation-inducible protein PsiE [Bacillus]PLR81156.1 phosphate-starvation-inducible protein PsiE [Bacillus sp. V33-4]PLR86387.1 phosphate-starvation-inducible protein PsiE [Bacillus canaveralius]PLR98620.1 phosphate-starvation-inducible protein PsiE [Bacillus canaveralius]RSK53942.1 phosphate-starvation-inducible protein PsiE [Bacillus canaveralius]
MSQQNKNNWQDLRITLLQFALNIALILLAISLCALLGKEIIFFIQVSIFNPELEIHYELLERILNFFLYFEFIAMVVKYFKEDYHFPIRYFLYIGITAMIRLIIVYHENPVNTLLYSFSILVLIVSFYIMNSSTARKGKL